MSIHAGVGVSQNNSDSFAAGRDASRDAIRKAGNLPQILFIFTASIYDPESVLRGAREAAPEALCVGGSAAGEITNEATVNDAVVALALVGDDIHFSAACAAEVHKGSFDAAARAAQRVKEQADNNVKLFISLPDGLTADGGAIVEGLQSVLGKNFPIIGGSLGDDYHFIKTQQFYNDEMLTDAVVGVGVSGNFSFGFGVKHGWNPVGLPMKVTRSEGTVIKEIDGEPALRVYENYFGKKSADLTKEPLPKLTLTYPLGIPIRGDGEYLIRDPIAANEAGEITMTAPIPEGSEIRLMIGDPEEAIRAARTAAEQALTQLNGRRPRLIFLFNCMARNKLLGVRCHEENEEVHRIIGRDVPLVGFYTYGEQGPLYGKIGTPSYFHNETMTLLVLGD